jgi:dihydroxyacetone kinase-like protein
VNSVSSLSSHDILRWLGECVDVFAANKDRLTALDSAIGDGDHGANMARGFTAVRAKLPELVDKDIGTIFKAVAMTLISTVGGASGPLYGTFFLQAAGPARGKPELLSPELLASFEAGIDGVIHRGKAAVGDKTMVDALVPAIEGLRPRDNDSIEAALARAAQAARVGADTTVPMIARKGRASYLGKRSAGHLDPGAESSVLFFEALARVVQSAR